MTHVGSHSRRKKKNDVKCDGKYGKVPQTSSGKPLCRVPDVFVVRSLSSTLGNWKWCLKIRIYLRVRLLECRFISALKSSESLSTVLFSLLWFKDWAENILKITTFWVAWHTWYPPSHCTALHLNNHSREHFISHNERLVSIVWLLLCNVRNLLHVFHLS
jgi:hypothetical protein